MKNNRYDAKIEKIQKTISNILERINDFEFKN
jgi:hypothetical protein